MPRTYRRWILAAVVASMLVLAPALPAVAAPAGPGWSGFWSVLQGWLAWTGTETAEHGSAPDKGSSKTGTPSVGDTPTLSLEAPVADSAQAPPTGSGENLPSIDPDG